jgi:hypothetical protein
MLTQEEQSLLSLVDPKELNAHFEAIASFERRSDGEGEAGARAYIERELRRWGITCSISKETGILAFGRSGTLRVRPDGGAPFDVSIKAWNFSAPAPRDFEGRGKAMMETPSLTVLDYLASRKAREKQKDLDGYVILSRSFSPQLILDAESRGAAAFVICWPYGGEKEIHHSGTVMWWGTPMPEEAHWRPGIPVVAVNAGDGERLFSEAGNLLFSFSFESEEKVTDVFQVEASIPSTTGEPYFLLVGAHLDSKCLGATDNATGSAIALSLAQAVSKCERRGMGLRVCWWSGHEFGRYTGSSIYARDRFDELERYCVAYTNIDMPGMKGATDFGTVTAGPDLFELAARTVSDCTGHDGVPSASVPPMRVRSWDQSFQNMGVSPFFIWTSSLPKDSPDRTGTGTMPWWWHTEADTSEFCDRDILNTDARIYMTGILRLLSGTPIRKNIFDIPALWQAVRERFVELERLLPREIFGSAATKLSALEESLEEGLWVWQSIERSFEESLRAVRLLNRVYYSARDAHLQDWDNGSDFVPGLSEACRALDSLRNKGENGRAEVIIVNYARTQLNRIGLLVRELLMSISC